MPDKAIPPDRIEGIVSYAIPHLVVRVPTRPDEQRRLYEVEGRAVRVEQYASHILTNAGWTVVKGDDAHLFFSILSCNFRDSFFREVCGNWVGADAEERIAELNDTVLVSLESGRLHTHLVDQAEAMLLQYYASYSPKQVIHSAIAEQIRSIDQKLLLRVIAFYRRMGYRTKGAPDLFAANRGAFWFIEVKSLRDSLSAAQYEFFEGYLTSVGQNILILRVVPESSRENA